MCSTACVLRSNNGSICSEAIAKTPTAATGAALQWPLLKPHQTIFTLRTLEPIQQPTCRICFCNKIQRVFTCSRLLNLSSLKETTDVTGPLSHCLSAGERVMRILLSFSKGKNNYLVKGEACHSATLPVADSDPNFNGFTNARIRPYP